MCRRLPAIVGFSNEQDSLVGLEAERRLARNWQNTVFGLKDMMGKTMDDIHRLKSKWGFKVFAGKKALPEIEVETKNGTERFSPPHIVSLLFAYLKEVN